MQDINKTEEIIGSVLDDIYTHEITIAEGVDKLKSIFSLAVEQEKERIADKVFEYCKENGKLVWVRTEDVIDLINNK